jgi:hypothetical protein
VAKVYGVNDDLQLRQNELLRYRKVSYWIEHYPELVFNYLYLPVKLELYKIKLTHEAYVTLKKSLAKKNPELFKKMILKQQKRINGGLV